MLLDELPRLTMPVLVLWGALDRVLPVCQARAAAGRLPRGNIVILENCGHVPHMECPEEVIAALDPFLTANAA